MSVTTSFLPDGRFGETYSATLAASGESGAVTWSIESGSLPDGLCMDGSTGTISGTPGKAGLFVFTVCAAAENGTDDSRELSIRIAEPKPDPRPDPESRKGKEVLLQGLNLNGSDSKIALLYPSRTPSYNGKAHVWTGTELSARQRKRKAADLDIGVEGLPETVSADYKYGKNTSASDGKAYYFIKLHPDKASVYYKSLSSENKKNLKKAVRSANKLLKKKENRIFFTIWKLDLSEFAFDRGKSKRGKYVFVRKDGGGDTLIYRKRKYEYRDGFELKEVTKFELMANLSGNIFKISYNEYKRTISKGVLTIAGKGKNLMGEITTKDLFRNNF